MFSFSYYELFPEVLAILLKASKIVLNVRAAFGSVVFLVKNEPRVF
jgi:hypothetical protein